MLSPNNHRHVNHNHKRKQIIYLTFSLDCDCRIFISLLVSVILILFISISIISAGLLAFFLAGAQAWNYKVVDHNPTRKQIIFLSYPVASWLGWGRGRRAETWLVPAPFLPATLVTEVLLGTMAVLLEGSFFRCLGGGDQTLIKPSDPQINLVAKS